MMKTLILVLCLAASSVNADPISRIIKCSDSRYARNEKWVRSIVGMVHYWSVRTKTPHEKVLDTMLIVESGFNPHSISKARCYGIGQINPVNEPYFRSVLKKYVHLMPSGMNYQVALAVIAFKCKLKDAHGDVWEGVRRYNGKGPAAEHYRRKTEKLYLAIFSPMKTASQAGRRVRPVLKRERPAGAKTVPCYHKGQERGKNAIPYDAAGYGGEFVG